MTQQLHSSPLHSQFLCKVVKLTQPCRQIFLYENTTTKDWLSSPLWFTYFVQLAKFTQPCSQIFYVKTQQNLDSSHPIIPGVSSCDTSFSKASKNREFESPQEDSKQPSLTPPLISVLTIIDNNWVCHCNLNQVCLIPWTPKKKKIKYQDVHYAPRMEVY